jgi:hypothetical protein
VGLEPPRVVVPPSQWVWEWPETVFRVTSEGLGPQPVAGSRGGGVGRLVAAVGDGRAPSDRRRHDVASVRASPREPDDPPLRAGIFLQSLPRSLSEAAKGSVVDLLDTLELGHCPTCGANALIGSVHRPATVRTPERTRIVSIECSDEKCLHFPTVLSVP